MSILLHGDCLEEMKGLDDNSIDLIFCDLPYGQTSCKWDCCIDLEKFWIEVMRIKKLNTPIFFTTTTKFGVSLINSCPKKCPFRFDIVWVKSALAGFLSAKKMPMRKHEMVYVFYEKLPFYDLSSHTHKFIKHKEGQIKPPTKSDNSPYGGEASRKKQLKLCVGGQAGSYDPPLPVSIVKEELNDKNIKIELENTIYGDFTLNNQPTNKDGTRNKYRGELYNPPLPVSVVKEENKQDNNKDFSVEVKNSTYGTLQIKQPITSGARWDPALPTTMLEIKSTRGKHSTEKPVALMEWVLKYYSKEGDTILDPTMGSGSTGVACKNMNRNFIGIEMDDEIYEVAVNRIED